jgi:hypothetical protein
MNQLNVCKRTQVVAALVEGNSIRATVRMTGASKNAIQRLPASLGPVMHYNFCRVHQTLCVTPAMEAGIADHVWSTEEIVGLLTLSREEAA